MPSRVNSHRTRLVRNADLRHNEAHCGVAHRDDYARSDFRLAGRAMRSIATILTSTNDMNDTRHDSSAFTVGAHLCGIAWESAPLCCFSKLYAIAFLLSSVRRMPFNWRRFKARWSP
jgi:hypothetical protein